MARSTRKSLAGKAATAARRAVSRSSKKAAPRRRPRRRRRPAKKAPAKKAARQEGRPAKKAAAKKAAPAKKAAAKKAAPAKKAARRRRPRPRRPRRRRRPAKKAARRRPPAKKAAAKKAAPRRRPARRRRPRRPPRRRRPSRQGDASKAPRSALVVKAGEDAWTKAELNEVLGELHEQSAHSRRDHRDARRPSSPGLMRDAGDGAGNDQADIGSTTFERDHEMTVAQQRPRHAGPDRARPGADRRRHLRRLRVLRQADRQDAVDGFPACDTVPDMQAARGASLNHGDSDRPGARRRCSCPRLGVFAVVAPGAYAARPGHQGRWRVERLDRACRRARSSATSCSCT